MQIRNRKLELPQINQESYPSSHCIPSEYFSSEIKMPLVDSDSNRNRRSSGVAEISEASPDPLS
jgi:hypothetical protein